MNNGRGAGLSTQQAARVERSCLELLLRWYLLTLKPGDIFRVRVCTYHNIAPFTCASVCRDEACVRPRHPTIQIFATGLFCGGLAVRGAAVHVHALSQPNSRGSTISPLSLASLPPRTARVRSVTESYDPLTTRCFFSLRKKTHTHRWAAPRRRCCRS